MSSIHDNWERLVGATLKREQLRALSRADSLDSSSSIQSNLPFNSPLHRDIESLPTSRSEAENLLSPNVKVFSFHELKKATTNFRPESILGEGRFGCVYKGWINDRTLTAAKPGSGMAIAVKTLMPEGFVHGHKEWLEEVNYLGQLNHPNLVKHIGYCSDGVNRHLVLEFMPKGSLENHLFKRPESLSWTTRIKVVIGAARGLSFLHEAAQQVVYRDFKSSNILLDSEFNAKLSNYGLAYTGHGKEISTRFLCTHGYIAPEGLLTAKSNVYSFGVVLLELLSGRRALDHTKVRDERNLIKWTRRYIGDKREVFKIMDIKLEGQYPREGMYKVASIAQQCLSPDPKQRPRMANVLSMLEELQSPEDMTKHL